MPIKIAFSMEGNMGSIILRTNFVKKFVSLLPRKKVEVTIFGHPNMEITHAIFDNLDFVDYIRNRIDLKKDIFEKYDLILRIDTFPIVLYKTKRLKLKSSIYSKIVERIERFAQDRSSWITSTAIFRPYIYQLAKMRNKNCVNCIDFDNFVGLEQNFEYKISIPDNIHIILSEHGLKEHSYITINRGSYTIPGQGEGTRVWPVKYYEKLVSLLKETFPKIKVIQLGQTADCPKISGVDLNLCGRTNIEELKCLLHGAITHIDGEGGMVHLRKAMNSSPSVVLFGATDPEYFGHKTNINLYSGTCSYRCCEMHDLWISKCLKSEDGVPLCLLSLTPETVYRHIADYLKTEKVEQDNWLDSLWPGTQELIRDDRFVLDYDWVMSWLRYEKITGYSVKKVALKDLYYWKQLRANGKGAVVSLTENTNAAVAFNNQDIKSYNDYNKLKEDFHKDTFHNQTRYESLISKISASGYDLKTGVIVVDVNNVILDGWHRASYFLSKYGDSYELEVVKLDNSYFQI